MVDKNARKVAAEILRHFLSGQIYNFDFDDSEPMTDDRVIHAIWNSMWLCYCDIRKHKMKGKWELPKEIKRSMSIWILFLYSEEEYLWPEVSFPGVRPLKHSLISRLLGAHKKEKRFMQSGEYSVWPFINIESFENAKRHPKLLAGS